MLMLVGMVAPQVVGAQGWGFAAEIGSVFATAGDAAFVFRLTPARALSTEFSLAGSFYLTPSGDTTVNGGALLAQFHVPVRTLRVTPFLGFGGIRTRTPAGSDTAVWFPLGGSLDYRVGQELFLVGTLSINLHAIEIASRKDDSSIGLTAGIRYHPGLGGS
jgi:hypothetical protein